MLYLFLAICCSSSIALIFKYTEEKCLNRYQVTSFNYLTASIFSLVMILKSDVPLWVNVGNPIDALVGNFTGNITAQGSISIAISLGIVTGVLYLAGFLLYQVSIKNCGASLACMFNKMGIIIPMILSIVLFKEMPTALKWIGIVLTVFAIIIVNLDFGKDKKNSLQWSLLVMFFVTGFSELSNKIFQKFTFIEYKNHFLLVLFFTALVLSIVLLIKNSSKQNRISLKAALCGIAVGIPNMLTTYFFIEALNHVQAAIAYPVVSAGTIVLTAFLSSIIFKEHLMTKEKVALVITLIGLILVNI